jgi:EAL domain-containing protein (putative c-di-GMP-specific phosphodiesterase class I)
MVPWWQSVLSLAAVVAAATWGGPAGAAAVAALAVAALAARASVLTTPVAPVAPHAGRATREAPGAAAPAEAVEPALRIDPRDTIVLYRPLRSLPELHLRGIEAELRWRHPQLGLCAPSDWPGAVGPETASDLLEAWLGQVLPQFARWLPGLRDRGGATLWLRLPAAWLALPSFGPRLTEALAAQGLDPSLLVLRVPLLVDGRRARLPASVLALQAQGVTLAVDAFGAGSASLTHLEHLPVRTVCLAPSFVERAAPGTPQRWVVESTARLAASMGMSTLAEGIAQENQVLALAALGCKLGVGEVCGPWLEASECALRWAGVPAERVA